MPYVDFTLEDLLQATAKQTREIVAETVQPMLDKAVDRLDARIDRMDAKFEQKFDGLEDRMGRLDASMGRLEGRMVGVEGRLGRLEGQVIQTASRLDSYASVTAGEYVALSKRVKHLEPGVG